jgi:adenylate cyclase
MPNWRGQLNVKLDDTARRVLHWRRVAERQIAAMRLTDEAYRFFQWPRVIAAAVFAIVFALLFHIFARDFPIALRVEHQLADWRTGFMSDRRAAQHPHIAVVLVDDEILKGLPYTSPFDRGVLKRLVDALDAAGAKAIALDFFFQRPTEPAKDQELIAAIRATKAPVILAAADERTGGVSEEEFAFQREFVAATGRPVGYVNLDEDRDDIVRRRIGPKTGGAYPVSFAARIAEVDGKQDAGVGGRMAWLRRPLNNADTIFTVNGTSALDKGPVGTAVRERLQGRMVIVGGGFPDRDRHRTPLFPGDGQGGSNTIHGVFLHAHALAQILDGRYVREIPVWPVVLLVSMAGFMLGAHFQHRGFNWISGTMWTSVIIALDLFLFWQFRWIVPYVAAVTAWLVGGVAGYLAARLTQRLAMKQGL